jgi:acyl-CoA thioester hydrolase
MLEYEYQFRVKYPETDQMATVHHSNYAKYYETARWELFRNIGVTYRSIEEAGYILPVIRMNSRFLKTIHYDDLITVKTTLKNIRGARMWFSYKLFNVNGELANEAEIELACVRKDNWEPCIIPEFLVKAIELNQNHELYHA